LWNWEHKSKSDRLQLIALLAGFTAVRFCPGSGSFLWEEAFRGPSACCTEIQLRIVVDDNSVISEREMV
jgi:hypothetical protein